MTHQQDSQPSHWIRRSPEDVLARLRGFGRSEPGKHSSAPVVLAVDGRSGSGKTTVTAMLSGAAPKSSIVSTDDIAWNHSFFGWADLLIDGVLRPLHLNGPPVAFSPPAWIEHGRHGTITVPAGTDVVFVEGVGAGREVLMPWIDAVIWIDLDSQASRARVVSREAARPGGDSLDFIHEWFDEEEPFLDDEKPWSRATLVVDATTVGQNGTLGVRECR